MQPARAGWNKTTSKCLRRQRVPATQTGAAHQTFESPANGSQEPLTYSSHGLRPPIAQANPSLRFRSSGTWRSIFQKSSESGRRFAKSRLSAASALSEDGFRVFGNLLWREILFMRCQGPVVSKWIGYQAISIPPEHIIERDFDSCTSRYGSIENGIHSST